VREPDRQGVEPGLRGGVRQDVWPGIDRLGGGDVDDRAAVSGRHPAPDHRHQAERALQVHAVRLVEQLFGDVLDGSVERGHAGVVDEHVDLPELEVDGVNQPVEGLPAADMGIDSQRAPSGLGGHLGGELITRGSVAAGDNHVVARAGEAQCHRPAESPTSTGDEGNPAVKVEMRGRRGFHRGLLLIVVRGMLLVQSEIYQYGDHGYQPLADVSVLATILMGGSTRDGLPTDP